MAQTQNDKLELFKQSIMEKAAAERDEILRAAEAQKRAELANEENRLLEEIYRKIQAQINEIKAANVKEISRETLAMKKQLYHQREQYLVELLARARVALSDFVESAEYEAFLLGRIERFARECPMEGSVIEVRAADLPYAAQIREIYGECAVEDAVGEIAIGGAILRNRKRGIEVDLSLDTALTEQRSWFYGNSNFNFDEAGETA